MAISEIYSFALETYLLKPAPCGINESLRLFHLLALQKCSQHLELTVCKAAEWMHNGSRRKGLSVFEIADQTGIRTAGVP